MEEAQTKFETWALVELKGIMSEVVVQPKSEVFLKSYKCVSVNGKSVRLHRVIMEQHIGRPLLPTEIVHHKNGDKWDNRIENLEITNRSSHASHHYIKEIVSRGGTGVINCSVCGHEKNYPLSILKRIRKPGEYVCRRCYERA